MTDATLLGALDPLVGAILVVVGTLVIFGAGMVVDLFSYAKPDDLLATVGGWVGFAIVLSGVFALPRMRPPTGA